METCACRDGKKKQRLSNLWLTGPIKRILKSLLAYSGKKKSLPYEWLRRACLNQPIFWGGAEAFTHNHKYQLLSERLKNKFSSRSSWSALEPIYNQFILKNKHSKNLNWMIYIDLNLRLPELLLMRVDKMSMGVSLEARVPFLDHVLVERAMQIPSRLKTKRGILKYILKKSVRGIIPDVIINRKKQGFGVPVYEWFFDKLGEQMCTDLRLFCERTDFFDYSEILTLIEEKRGPQLWYIYNFVLWWNLYISPSTGILRQN